MKRPAASGKALCCSKPGATSNGQAVAAMNRWSLRFDDSLVEAGFVEYLHSSAVSGFTAITRVTVFLLLIQVVLNAAFLETSGGHFAAVSRSQPAVQLRDGSFVLSLLFALVYMLLCRLQRRRRLVPLHIFEALASTAGIVGLPLIISSYPWYCAKIVALDPYEVVTSKSSLDDANLLIMLMLYSLAVHALPLRWVSLIAMEIVYIAVYPAVAFCLGSPMDFITISWNTLVLAGSIVIAAANRRQIERLQRLSFLTVLGEKTLRVQMEHQVERLAAPTESQGSQGRPRHRDAELRSMASTEGTGYTEGLFMNAVASHSGALTRLGHEEHWLVEASELCLLRDAVLGRGGFALVTAAEFHGAVVAMKVAKNPGFGGRRCNDSLVHELRLFRRLRHPAIVTFYGACFTPQGGELCLIMEYVQGLPLSCLDRELRLSPAQRCHVAAHVCSALAYLHAQDPAIVHGDIKDSNTMIQMGHDGCARAKLLDFGLSRILSSRSRFLGGTLRWMAPELLGADRSCTGPPVDVFSFGLLVYLLATGQQPYTGVSKAQLRAYRGSRGAPFQWRETLELPESARALAEACTQEDIHLRPSMAEVGRALSARTATSRLPGERLDEFLAELRGGPEVQPLESDIREGTANRPPGIPWPTSGGSTSCMSVAGAGLDGTQETGAALSEAHIIALTSDATGGGEAPCLKVAL